MRKKFFLLPVIIYSIICTAQKDPNIDSIRLVLKKQTDDTSKINSLNALSERFLLMKDDSAAAIYAGDALVFAEKINFEPGIIRANTNQGKVYRLRGNDHYYEGNYPGALKNYLAALTIFEKRKTKKEIASIRRNIGLVYWTQGEYNEALKNHFLSLSLWKELNDKNAIAASYNDIGNVYENQRNYDEALKNYLLSLKIYEEAGNREAMINRYFNIAFLYEDQRNYTEALKNHFAALKISEEIKSAEGIASCYTNIGGVYESQGKTQANLKLKESLFKEALKNYLQAVEKNKETEDTEGLAACYNSIGGLYFEMKNFHKAKQFLESGLTLFKKAELNEEERYQVPAAYIRDNYEILVKVDSSMGNWKDALQHHQLYIFYRDSVTNNEMANKLIKTQMQYDFDKKEDSLKYEQALTTEKFKEQKQAKNYLFAALGLVIILSFFIYRNYRHRQQLKLQLLRNKIASDLHDDLGSTLSSISICAQMAQQQSKEVNPVLETIGENSRKMIDAMADIVWTIQPGNDRFEKIILRMRNFAYEMLGIKKIDFEFIAKEPVPQMKLPMEIRKNFYLIFKEATNNMVKYSGADKASFTIKKESNKLMMIIQDNGKGFDIVTSTEGNGLGNMKKRAEEMGGEIVIDSHPAQGTIIQLKVSV